MEINKKNCKKCIYFTRTISNDKPSCIFNLENDICVPEYKDKYNGEIRPACSFAGTYGYVSHNPARLCRWYKEK